jgi:hypothetical protein
MDGLSDITISAREQKLHPLTERSVRVASLSAHTSRDGSRRYPGVRMHPELMLAGARILPALPRPVAPHCMGGQGSACGLHHAQTFRFPLVGPASRDAASVLHPAL